MWGAGASPLYSSEKTIWLGKPLGIIKTGNGKFRSHSYTLTLGLREWHGIPLSGGLSHNLQCPFTRLSIQITTLPDLHGRPDRDFSRAALPFASEVKLAKKSRTAFFNGYNPKAGADTKNALASGLWNVQTVNWIKLARKTSDTPTNKPPKQEGEKATDLGCTCSGTLDQHANAPLQRSEYSVSGLHTVSLESEIDHQTPKSMN